MKSKSFLIPTLVLVGFALAVITAMSIGERKPYSLARMLIQWDGQHYLSIAREGYQKYPCTDNPALICGNVGWFPIYPLAARAVGTILRPFGPDMRWGMLATSLLSFWLALLLLYRLIARRFDSRTATFSLIALVSFPTSFYFLTAFPYAFYLLLAVLVFYLLDTERFLAAALPAALLAATYPSGIVIGLPILWTLIAGRNRLAQRDKFSLLAATAAVGLGLLGYGLYYWYRFNDFFLYVHFQSKPYYAHEASFPLMPIIHSLRDLPVGHPIFVMLLFVIATLLLFYRRRLRSLAVVSVCRAPVHSRRRHDHLVLPPHHRCLSPGPHGRRRLLAPLSPLGRHGMVPGRVDTDVDGFPEELQIGAVDVAVVFTA